MWAGLEMREWREGGWRERGLGSGGGRNGAGRGKGRWDEQR